MPWANLQGVHTYPSLARVKTGCQLSDDILGSYMFARRFPTLHMTATATGQLNLNRTGKQRMQCIVHQTTTLAVCMYI